VGVMLAALSVLSLVCTKALVETRHVDMSADTAGR